MSKIKTNTKLNAEMLSIVGPATRISKESKYSAIIHADGKQMFVPTVISVDTHKDFVSNITDEITVNFLMPLGDFIKVVKPNLKKLEMTLISTVVGSKSKNTYKLVLAGLTQDEQNGTYDQTSGTELNKQDMTNLTGQCLNKVVEGMRSLRTYGVYKDTTVSAVMNTVLMENIGSFSALGGLLSSGDCKMASPDNTRTYKHIVVPDGTLALDIGSFFQHGDYGVFNGGLSTYIQKTDAKEFGISDSEVTYIYPLYGNKSISNYKPVLKIIALSPMTKSGIESTYVLDKGDLKIITSVASDVKNDDDSGNMNDGVGVTLLDSETVLTRPFEVSEDKVVVKRENVKRKQMHKKMADGVNKVKYVGTVNNLYDERAKVLRNNGRVVQLQWNFSNARLLIPGMKVIYITDDGKGGVSKKDGILHGASIFYEGQKKMEATILNVFLMDDKEEKST